MSSSRNIVVGPFVNKRTKEILKVSKQHRYLKLKYDIAKFVKTSKYPNIPKAKSRFETEGKGKFDKYHGTHTGKLFKR